MFRTRIRVVFLILSIYIDLIFSFEFDTSREETNMCYFTPIVQDSLSILIPQYYNVSLKIEELSFQGEANILVELLRKTEIIPFHVSYLEIDLKSIVFEQYNPNCLKIEQPKDIHYCNETSTVTLIFEEIVCPGYYNITMRYSGSLYEKKGFLKIKNKKEKGNVA
ncbi:hypothetical protein EAI_07549 [Harpegnathos saltator]|uniref:Uncharacterized protein n=2 Tax=Harpegnathos saltator TaxID=610380 RepID=E2C139_HARSA|nr:hypothetical protein EAI_07549 [Harpegnathos saltator]